MPALAAKFRARPRAKAVPPRAVRYANAPRPPAGTSLAYQLRLTQVAKAFSRRAQALFGPLGKAYSELEPGDKAPSLEAATKALKAYGSSLARSGTLGAAITAAGRDAARHATAEFKRLDVKPQPKALKTKTDDAKPGKASKQGIGLKLEPEIAAKLGDWREKNVSLITGALSEQADKIAALLADHQGSSHEVIAKKLEERFGITERRATLIARDQVLTLNAQITRHKFEKAGITKYIWTTAGDERVRGNPDGLYADSDEDHYALDGETFSFDDPPIVNPKTGETGNPGEPIQCRCVPYPVLDELEGEEEQPQEPEETEAPVAVEPEPEPVAPAPAPNELIEGVHIQHLELGTPEAKTAWERLKTTLTPEDLKYLETTPLKYLGIEPKLDYMGAAPNGLYYGGAERLELSLHREPGSYGHQFEPSVWSISATGATPEASQERTLTHEFGHHVHMTSGAEADRIVQEAFANERSITQYGRSSAEEYFAECFALARYHPAELEAYDRNGWDMVQKVLDLHRRPASSIFDI